MNTLTFFAYLNTTYFPTNGFRQLIHKFDNTRIFVGSSNSFYMILISLINLGLSFPLYSFARQS